MHEFTVSATHHTNNVNIQSRARTHTHTHTHPHPYLHPHPHPHTHTPTHLLVHHFLLNLTNMCVITGAEPHFIPNFGVCTRFHEQLDELLPIVYRCDEEG